MNYKKKGYSPLTLNALFKFARELQNIKQGEISKNANITSSAISMFEHGTTNFKEETIENIAHCLNISSDYAKSMIGNPFKSEKLIKMFVQESFLGRVDYSIFELFLDFNDKLQFLFLIPEFSIGKILKAKTIELSIYAIAMKDSDNNIFIFRRRPKISFFVGEKGFQTTMNKKAKKEKKDIDFKTIDIEKPIFYKILSWSIEREDVENLFGNKSESIDEKMIHDEGRIRLLNMVAEMGISPDKAIELLSKMDKINSKK